MLIECCSLTSAQLVCRALAQVTRVQADILINSSETLESFKFIWCSLLVEESFRRIFKIATANQTDIRGRVHVFRGKYGTSIAWCSVESPINLGARLMCKVYQTGEHNPVLKTTALINKVKLITCEEEWCSDSLRISFHLSEACEKPHALTDKTANGTVQLQCDCVGSLPGGSSWHPWEALLEVRHPRYLPRADEQRHKYCDIYT